MRDDSAAGVCVMACVTACHGVSWCVCHGGRRRDSAFVARERATTEAATRSPSFTVSSDPFTVVHRQQRPAHRRSPPPARPECVMGSVIDSAPPVSRADQRLHDATPRITHLGELGMTRYDTP